MISDQPEGGRGRPVATSFRDSGSPVIAVVGPTATGKTALGVRLARLFGGDVINADSMQLYRKMDIGTAKATPAERGGVPHHLLDIWPVTATASVAEYQHSARTVIDRLRAVDKVSVLVGGSGLYVGAVLDDLEFPGTDPELRQRLEAELAAAGPGPLHARLRVADPAAAEAILPSNGRRIVRALEVMHITGRPFMARLPDRPAEIYPAVRIGLDVAVGEGTASLDERIALRVDRMWQRGLVEEVRELLRDGLAEGRTAGRALGYAQVLEHLAGRCTEDEARQETIRATRRFVRRQRSWFRRDGRVRWLDADRPDLLEAAVSLVGRADSAQRT